MLYYDVANLVIVKHKCLTKTNMINEMACVYETWDPKNHCCEDTAPSLRSPADLRKAEVSAAPKFDYSISHFCILNAPPQLQVLQEHLRMLLQHLRALCLASEGASGIT
jgi:hypothetical protein